MVSSSVSVEEVRRRNEANVSKQESKDLIVLAARLQGSSVCWHLREERVPPLRKVLSSPREENLLERKIVQRTSFLHVKITWLPLAPCKFVLPTWPANSYLCLSTFSSSNLTRIFLCKFLLFLSFSAESDDIVTGRYLQREEAKDTSRN